MCPVCASHNPALENNFHITLFAAWLILLFGLVSYVLVL